MINTSHRLRTMVKMARSHTSGQHALSCTAVEPGQLDAAEWRLRHSSYIPAKVSPGRGLGAAVSAVRLQAEWLHLDALNTLHAFEKGQSATPNCTAPEPEDIREVQLSLDWGCHRRLPTGSGK